MEAWGLEPQRLDSVPARRSGAEIEHRGRQTRLVGAGRTPWKPRISTRSAGGRDEWDPGTPLRAIGFGRRLGDKRARGRAETPVSAKSRLRELRRGDAQDPDRSHVRRRRPGRVPRGSASRSRSSRVPQSSGCSDLGGNEPHVLQQCSAARLPNGSSGDEPMDGSGPRGREAMRGANRRGGEKPRGRNEAGLGCLREWTPLVDVAKGAWTPRKVLGVARHRAGTDWRTLKERRSLREDEPIAKVIGDGER